MSRYSHLIEVGDAVRILEGKHIGEVGKVNAIWDTKVVVGTHAGEVAVDRDGLEPLFDLERGIVIKVEEHQSSKLTELVKPFGMTSEELAEEVDEYLRECVGRIRGVGKDQYDSQTHQKFEEMDLDELFVYAREEMMDIANYAAFLDIRIRRIQKALSERDDLGVGTEEEFEQTDYSVNDFQDGRDE